MVERVGGWRSSGVHLWSRSCSPVEDAELGGDRGTGHGRGGMARTRLALMIHGTMIYLTVDWDVSRLKSSALALTYESDCAHLLKTRSLWWVMGKQNMEGGTARTRLSVTIHGTMVNFTVDKQSPSSIGVGSRALLKEKEVLWPSPVDQTRLTC